MRELHGGRCADTNLEATHHEREGAAASAAEVTSYDARRAVEIRELEDEGPGFYIELADGRVLFIQGQ